MSYYRQQLEQFLSELDVKATKVFDIGGKQGEVKNRVKSWDVQYYKVLDLPEFDLNYPLVRDNQFNKEYGTDANLIFCLEVFEYIYNPYDAMQNIAELLKYTGRAYITFPFVYPHHNELEMDSLRYTEPGIHRLAEAAGLRVTNTWYRRDKSGLLKQFYAADGMRAAKEYPDHSVTGFICELRRA